MVGLVARILSVTCVLVQVEIVIILTLMGGVGEKNFK